MKLPDFVNQSSVDLTNRVSGFFGNEVKHDSLITGIEDLYLNTKKLHDNVVTMEEEVEKDTVQVRGDRVVVEELSDRVFDAAHETAIAHGEIMEAKDRVLVAETNAINSANTASSDAGKAKLSEEFALNYSHDAKNFANNSLLYSEDSHKYFDLSYEIYEDLRKGQVYRGTWNPHTGAYPDPQGTNSAWDVVLNEGEEEYTWNGTRWFWGDRLIYVKETNTYSQIESGTGGGVTSVNGKRGAVTLKAIDVGAVPLDGSVAMTGGLSTKAVTIDNDEARVFNSEGEAFVQSTKNFGSTLFGADTKNAYLVSKDNPHVRRSGSDYKLYHEGYKPTALDVNALPLTGGEITGPLSIRTERNEALVLEYSASGAGHVRGKEAGQPDWYVGRANAVGDIALYSNKHGNGLVVRNNDIQMLKNVSVEGGISTKTGVTITGTGNIQAMPGGFLRCNTENVMSMDGKNYSFVTSHLDAHLCSNAYWDGAAWRKYDNSRPSMYAVANQSGEFFLRSSSPTSTNPNELRPLYIDKVGNTHIGGTLDTAGAIKSSGTIEGSYMQVRNSGNPSIEFHDPGKNAVMMYKPQGTGTIRFCQSNGAGGEALGYGVVDADGFSTVAGRFRGNYSAANRSWTSTGQCHFFGENANIAGNGTLFGLVGKSMTYPGAYAIEQYFGHYAGDTNADNVAHAFVGQGSGYLRQWFLYNGGRLQSPIGGLDGSFILSGHSLIMKSSNNVDNARLTSSGLVEGSAYGVYGNLVSWAVASFAPASDEKLKKNIKPTVKSALSDIAKVQFHSYEWKEDEVSPVGAKPVAIGLVAQEMEAIDPSYTRDIETFGEDAISVKTLDVTNMLALAIKGIQELTEANAKLTERVAMLEASKLV